jgi:uncharacterized LabA/DUF88 family protein
MELTPLVAAARGEHLRIEAVQLVEAMRHEEFQRYATERMLGRERKREKDERKGHARGKPE